MRAGGLRGLGLGFRGWGLGLVFGAGLELEEGLEQVQGQGYACG